MVHAAQQFKKKKRNSICEKWIKKDTISRDYIISTWFPITTD